MLVGRGRGVHTKAFMDAKECYICGKDANGVPSICFKGGATWTIKLDNNLLVGHKTTAVPLSESEAIIYLQRHPQQ